MWEMYKTYEKIVFQIKKHHSHLLLFSPQEQNSFQPISFKPTVFLICAKHWAEVGRGRKLRWFPVVAALWVSPTLWRGNKGRKCTASTRPAEMVPSQLTLGPRGASPLFPGHGSLHVRKAPPCCQCACANSTGLARVGWRSNRSL